MVEKRRFAVLRRLVYRRFAIYFLLQKNNHLQHTRTRTRTRTRTCARAQSFVLTYAVVIRKCLSRLTV